ncbi:hypothetical protein SH580_13110 [Coraliomargarita algicola]|uniref:Uncharacterized protein n=1 Tax=Coraliomargarita algicola TaxID=3092156 RepID=A0ABZ0RGY8_9BACT|nr:hypothetical protein [Coraliomargarita sp. J2-16]WPJ94373.1 hypothetical protein SH580_13110 [Coraliomargarita sp. J2-16]
MKRIIYHTQPPKGGTPSFYAAIKLMMASLLPMTGYAIPADELAAIKAELSEPITLRLKNRNTVSGNPFKVSKDQIQIASAEGAGEIIFTFQTDEIREISVPGESYKSVAAEWMQAGNTEDALELMSMLYAQRGPLLPLLPASESHFFTYYVDLVLDSPKPARAIAIIQTLRPQIENPEALRALDDSTLESYQTLELYDDAVPLAEAWVAERKPFGESALGYYVLGAARLRDEAYEEALDLALRPIVFASPIPTDKLAECYAVAVSAALGLRERPYAATLYQEMQTRGFQWPRKDRSLQATLKEITEYIKDHEEDTPESL